jgi:hypothetical protein
MTEGRENGGFGAVAPKSGVHLNLQISETRILITFFPMYFPRNWNFGSALSKLRNFGGGGRLTPPPQNPLGTPLTTWGCTGDLNKLFKTKEVS